MTLAGLALSLPIPRSALRSIVRAFEPKRRVRLAGLGMVGLTVALGAGAVFLYRFGARRRLDQRPITLLPTRSAAA